MHQPEIIAETDNYLVINKPANMAVEPPSREKTLQDWLIDHQKIKSEDWTPEQRLGVVHRLDTDTSGVLVWAKNPTVQEELKQLWQGRAVKKSYLALVVGECPASGTIELPIMRDNRNDKQVIAWLNEQRARSAITEYERVAIGQYNNLTCSLVRAHPITGRTHQIRVHLKAIGHPIVGDELYGEKATQELAKKLQVDRQFLHAEELHIPNQPIFTATLPVELRDALKKVGINHVE